MPIIFLLLITQTFSGHHYFKNITTGTDVSFRGLSVVDNSVAWVGGTKGSVGKTVNGGTNWTFYKVNGCEQCDFRSVYAFDERHAVITNAGSPAYIFKTNNGGETWDVVYKNEDTAAFIDGIDFWNDKEGIVFGDPLKGRMMILRTGDGGEHWRDIPDVDRPALDTGEASFAASGTTIKCHGKKGVIIATGGRVSRLWTSDNRGESWEKLKTPALHGQSSTGIFSIGYHDSKAIIIAGGDYKNDTLKQDHIFYTQDGGKTWLAPKHPTGGYRECITYANDETVFATGPGGIDISEDGGLNWRSFSSEKGFHVARKSRHGNLIIFAGAGGKISLLQQPPH